FAASMPPEKLEAFTMQARVSGYWTPRIPMDFAPVVARFARASTDVSDGLIADAGNIARASGVALRIDANAIPLSAPGRAFVADSGSAGLVRLVTAGDDYQALFTGAPESRDAIAAAARGSTTAATRIGIVAAGEGVTLLDAGGRAIETNMGGYSHKLG